MSIIMSRRSIVPMLQNTIRRNVLELGTNHHRRTTIATTTATTAVSNMISSSSASVTATRWFTPLSSMVSMSRSSIPLDTSIIMQQHQQQQRCWSSTSSGTSSSSSSEDAATTNHDSTQEPPPVNDAPNDATTTESNNVAEESTDNMNEAEVIDEDLDEDLDEEPVVVEEDATIVAARKQSQQMREMKDALLRSLAEQENTRAIAKRDVEQARQFAIKSFAKSLLDVADNLQRALDAVPKEYRPVTAGTASSTEVVPTTEPLAINPDIFKTLYEGIEMTEKGLKKALEGHGVVQYGTVGDLFDPNKHEALMEYNDDTKMNNTVGIVMKCGYTLHSRVLRPAEVGVVKSTMTTTTTTSE